MRTTPHKRCKALEDKIIKRIREGASFSDAPRLEGIDEATFRRWRQCEKESDDVTLPLRDRRCWSCTNCTLQAKCDTAESHFKHECVQTIFTAGEENWRARAWILERRYRDEYTTREIVEVKGGEEPFDPSRALVNALIGGVMKRREREDQIKRPGVRMVT
jgi:hypothetical protein